MDILQLGDTIDDLEISVVCDLESTPDGLEDWEREVLQVWVVSEDKISSGSEVGSFEGFEEVGVESEETLRSLEGWDIDRADVAESHVQGVLKVDEGDFEIHMIGREASIAGDVGNLGDISFHQVGVVADFHVANGFQRDTLQVGQVSVGDANVLGLGNTLGEGELLYIGKGFEVESANLGEGVELDGPQLNSTAEHKSVANGSNLGGEQASQVLGAFGGQTAGDFLDAIDYNVSPGDLRSNIKVTLEFLAGGEG